MRPNLSLGFLTMQNSNQPTDTILCVAIVDTILSGKRKTKALIRLRECAGLSVPLLFLYPDNRFSCDKDNIFFISYLSY